LRERLAHMVHRNGWPVWYRNSLPKEIVRQGRRLRTYANMSIVQDKLGYALFVAQAGGKHPSAKPLKGFTGARVLEIVEDYAGDTYRAIYTVRFEDVVYMLRAFQKKSKKGIATRKHEVDLIRARLKDAQALHAVRAKHQERTS